MCVVCVFFVCVALNTKTPRSFLPWATAGYFPLPYGTSELFESCSNCSVVSTFKKIRKGACVTCNRDVQDIDGGWAADSSPLQPGVLNLCFRAQITFSRRYLGSQGSKDGKVIWPNTGLKDYFFWNLRFTSHWDVCETLTTKADSAVTVFKTGDNTWPGRLGMPVSWQRNRGCLLPSRLRENLEHLCHSEQVWSPGGC